MANFLDLPPELKSAVFKSLPLKNIQLLRRVCKDFQAVIDQSTNRKLLIDSSAADKALSHILDVHADIANFNLRTCDLLTLFKRVLGLRGYRIGPNFYNVTCLLWLHQQAPESYNELIEEEEDPDDEIFNALRSLVRDFILIHLCHHSPLADPMRKQYREIYPWLMNKNQFLIMFNTLWGAYYERLGLSDDVIANFYDRIVDDGELREACHKAPIHHFLFTTIKSEEDHKRLCEVLDVPLIPEFASAINYGVKTQWAFDKVIAVVKKREPMTEVQRAAIKEQVFIY